MIVASQRISSHLQPFQAVLVCWGICAFKNCCSNPLCLTSFSCCGHLAEKKKAFLCDSCATIITWAVRALLLKPLFKFTLHVHFFVCSLVPWDILQASFTQPSKTTWHRRNCAGFKEGDGFTSLLLKNGPPQSPSLAWELSRATSLSIEKFEQSFKVAFFTAVFCVGALGRDQCLSAVQLGGKHCTRARRCRNSLHLRPPICTLLRCVCCAFWRDGHFDSCENEALKEH